MFLIPPNQISHITPLTFVKKINSNKCVKKNHNSKNSEIIFSDLMTQSKRKYLSD